MLGTISDLGSRRMLLVTGKGGTGKSITAVALARLYAESGKKVWLIEMGRKRDQNFSRLHELLETPMLTHELSPIALAKGTRGKLWAARLDPTESLGEYVALKIPGGSLAGLLLKNRVTGSLLEIVPGLIEIVSLGKLWFAVSQVQESAQPDLIIIDGPASGHAVTLLTAPDNFARLTKHGPLYKDAVQMQTFLENPQKFACILVSLPEVMPLSEAKDLLASLKQIYYVPLLLINKCMPDDELSAKDKIPKEAEPALRFRHHRRQEEQKALAAFSADLTIEQIPLFFPSTKQSLVDRLLQRWKNP